MENYFLCSLRNLRLYRMARKRVIRLAISMNVKYISMSDILIYLHVIKQNSSYKEYNSNQNPCCDNLNRKFLRKNITDNWNANHQLAHIITELGNVVYLFLIHHVIILKQFRYHSVMNCNLLRNNEIPALYVLYYAQESV